MWYYVQNGGQQGPVNEEELAALVQAGTVTKRSLLWKEGMADWTRADRTAARTLFVAVPRSVRPPAAPGAGSSGRRAESVTKSAAAVASLILGITSLALFLGPLTGIPAAICGHLAQSRIKRAGGRLAGGELAFAGLVTGYLGAAMGLLIGITAIAVPAFVQARNTARANDCINNMRVIDSAKEQWALANAINGGAEVDVAGVNEYIKGCTTPMCPVQGVYTYDVTGRDPACSKHGALSEAMRDN